MILTYLPLWLSGLLLVGIPIVLAMVGPILIRRRLGLERLSTNNEVAGFKFAYPDWIDYWSRYRQPAHVRQNRH